MFIMSSKVANVVEVVNQALQFNDIDLKSDLFINTNQYDCSVVLGAQKGQLYAFFYKKVNSCWVETLLLNARACIEKMRKNIGDVDSAVRLESIEKELFDNELNEGYLLIEIGATKLLCDCDNLPMFYSL